MNHTINTIYFSPTSTAEKITRTIASRLCDSYKEYNITLPDKREKYQALSFDKDDVVIISVPVYKGRIPNFLVDYFSKYRGNNTKAIFTVLYGNRAYDDALLELKDIFEERGFICIAAGAFIGEHSNTALVAFGRPDVDDLNIAMQFADDIKVKLNNIIDLTTQTLTVKGNFPYKISPQNSIIVPETNDRCTDCSICANTCPMGAINFTDFRDIDPSKCIMCNSCVKKCPENAKAFIASSYKEFTEVLINHLALGRKEPELFL